MNVLIDTNIILDDIISRMPNAEAARKISQLITDELVNGFITANSLTDIFYIVSKSRGESIARITVKNLLINFVVISIDGEDCHKAINLPMRDFEDALIAVCAEKANLDYIITNDKEFLKSMDIGIPAVSPVDFLSKLV